MKSFARSVLMAAISLSVWLTSVAIVSAEAGKRSFEVYGFAQVDYIQDFNRVNPDWNATLRPSRIPTTEGTFGDDGQAIVSVRQSKIGAQANMPTAAGDVYTKLEFDFFGVGEDAGQTTIRLRHAYGQFKQWLGGQTNSLFMDGSIFPNTIDYWGPTGMVFLRNPQIRWSPMAGKNTLSFAIEHPNNDVDASGVAVYDPTLGASIAATNPLPDFTGQFRHEADWGHVQAAGILRRVAYETLPPAATAGNQPSGHDLGWGVDLTSNLKIGSKNTIHGGFVFGEGIASYMNDGGMDMGPSVDGAGAKGETVPLMGVLLYYDHYWSNRWSSSFGVSRTEVENTDLQTGDAYRRGQYVSANILHYPTTDLFYGIEWLWGERKDNDGAVGTDNRIQVSAHYKFSTGNLFERTTN